MPKLLTHLLLSIFLFNYSEALLDRVQRGAGCQFCMMRGGQCFQKSQWCDGRTDCPDRRDENYCLSVHPNCGNFHDSCDSGKCIPKYWFCDGSVDCPDGSDEECINGERVSFLWIKEGFRNWTLQQRSNTWGWEKDTPRAIVALYLMNTTEYSSGNSDSALAAKELEVQLSFDLFRSHYELLEEVKMAQYIHAMLATCIDPSHFHGLNLLSTVEERLSKQKFVRPFTLLSLCNAGHPISQKHIDILKKIIKKPNDPIWIDTKALATMALTCAADSSKDSSLNETIFNSLLTMKSLQRPDGSFGDARTSAVIMQALVSNRDFKDWNFLKGIKSIIEQRKNDSSGMLTNYLIMPLLSKHTLLDLGKVDCSYKRNATMRESMERKLGKKIHVMYSTRIGDKEDLSYTATFRVPVNTTLFQLMTLASEMDKRYSLQWRNHQDKKYIYSIGSIDNDPELQKYWTLYKMSQTEAPVLVQTDVDDVYLNDNDHYIFWYKTVIPEEFDKEETGNSTATDVDKLLP